ncbi:MARTX multifunctional-autoprocessing repeats-in-toxin holotoxin RtxA [Vibrio cholerae]|uniref:MARTX multifunctional-autoprocessing repeats-in-toxin holotoxin RtxA n=1 Tax=Vibrio cholerae TaxID=666 RepID=UPI00166B6199|nr:Multifunctional-autoprocessing repeats-in-toxin [Vibrio cholerae]GFK57834.1 Multifunctional-autoprocessing repeats-in-toxin [Vibrio cholerae]GFK61129.1 Multifunctional-autoprocessing repeats-in-toxin [Vibrio cholerae]GFK64673.1 Multifunctional-autoprocessing repeats-in-toxin [Vibrio cholerae]GFK69369.1 Multifunctional-autoprocessing repeats-in-toxin [Vibrio cholerae]
MGKPFWRSVEYFFTGNYSADDGNNNIVAIGFGGQIHAYGGDDHVTVGSIGAMVYTGSGNDTVVGGSAYLKVEDSTGHLTVKGAAGYAHINKSGDGNVSFAGAAGGVSIDHLGNHGDISYGGAAAYNGITRKGLSGNVTFAGAGGYNALWHETNQGNLSFTGAGAGNKLDRTWFNRYQGSHGDVTFDGAGAANSISSRVETGNITFRGAGADNHLVRKGKVGDITLQGAGASNRIERTRQAEDVYAQTRGNIRFEGVGGYNSLYSDVAHGDIHFSGGGAYNTITRKGSGSSFDAQGMEYAKAEEIVLTAAQMHGLSIDNGNKFHAVTAVKSEREPNTYLFAIADGTYTKINKVRLYNDPETGKLKYYSEAWFKRGNHLAELARSDVSSAGGFEVNPINGGYTLSNIAVEHQQSVTVHAVEKNLTEYEWVTYANGTLIDAKDVALSEAKMGGYAISTDGTTVDVQAVKSNRKPNTYIYAKVLGPHTKIVVVELANDPETGALKYQARSWYKEGDHTANLANEDISSANGYHSMGKGGYSLSDLHYSVNAVRSTSETVADIDEYTDQTLFKPATDSGESSGDVRFNGAGGGNVIKSNVTRGNVYFNGGGIANVILHSSQFGNTEFNGGGAANVIVKSGEEGDLTFRGAGLANVLVHQSKQGKMDVYAGGAVNVLVRIGDGQYLAHLLAYGNISVHKGNGNSRVVMLGGYNTHTQIGSGNGLWLAAGGFNVMTQVGKGDVASVLAGGANVLTKVGDGDLTAGMLGGANVITHISGDNETSNTTAVALGGANILTKKGKGNTLAVMGGGANVLTHVGDGTTTGVMVGGANILTKVGNGDTTGIMLGVGNVLTHVGDGQTLGVMGAAGNIFTKVGDGTSLAIMIGVGNIFTHVGEGNAWALMGGLGNVFTKVGNGDALALMVAEANVFTHIGDGMSVALMLAKGNVATKVGNGTTLTAMVGNANIFTHVGSGSTFAAMIGQANIMTKVGNDLTAALMVGKANIYTHVGDGTSLGIFAGEVNVMTKVGNGTTLAAMFGKANIMTHVGDGLTGVLALGEANIVTKVGDDFMGVVAAAKANVVTHVGDATTAAVLAGKGNILTKVGEGTTVGLLISDIGNVMTHVGDGTTIGIAKGKANIITKVGDGLGVNVAWGQANVFTQVGDGDRYNFAKGEANIITKVGDGQEVSVVQGKANIITHVGNGDDYTGAWGKANVITKVGNGRNVVLAKGEANIVTQVGDGDSFNALWSKGNIVTKVGDGMQVTAAKGQANITTTVGNGLNVTAAYGDANINTKVGDGVSVNVAWGKYNINTKVGDGLNVAVMKGKANANIHVGDGLNINASYAQNNVAIKVGNGDFYSLAVASSNTSSNKLSALFDNIKQTVLGVGGSQAINYLVQGDEASSSGTHKGRGAIATPEITKLDGFQMDAIKEVSSDLGDSLTGSVTKVDTPDLNKMQHALNVDDSSVQASNLIVNGDFEQGDRGWKSTHGVEASHSGKVYGVNGEGHGARVTELDTHTNTSIYQDLANLAQGEVIAVSFDFAKRAGLSNNEGIEVLWNGEVVFSSSGDESAWQQKTLKLTAQAGSNRIEFKGTGHNDGLGYILDNVVATSESSQQANAIREHATQNPAAQNALSDKERAEADRQRLEQEKQKQLDAVAGSQSQLESTDQQALENNGQAQRDAVQEESEAITAELTKLAQGLDVLDSQATHTGESGDQWRNEFASGLLAGVQTQLDDAKQLANGKIAEAKQTHADNQNKVKDAVAKSEAGVAKGEQNRAGAEQDIADAQADAEKRKADALAKGKDAQQAESDAHHAVNNAQSRGDRDVQVTENKATQAQADAQGAKQNEGDRPDRQGVTGSGLSGNAHSVEGAGETDSHVKTDSQTNADGRFSEGLTEQEQEALEGATNAVNRLQINAGIRAKNSGSTITTMFTEANTDSIAVPTTKPQDVVRKEIRISGVNLEGLGEASHDSAVSLVAARAEKVANLYRWLDSDHPRATEQYIDSMLRDALPFYSLRTERNLLVQEGDEGFKVRAWPGNDDKSKTIVLDNPEDATQQKTIERFILANFQNFEQMPDELFLVDNKVISHDKGITHVLAQKVDGVWLYNAKVELMSVTELLDAANVTGKIRGESYQQVIDGLSEYHSSVTEFSDYEQESIEKLLNLRKKIKGYVLGHPDSGRVEAMNSLLNQVNTRLEEVSVLAVSESNIQAQDSFSRLYDQLETANLKGTKHLYLDQNGEFVTKGKGHLANIDLLGNSEAVIEKVKSTVSNEYGQTIADTIFAGLTAHDLAKDGKGIDIAGLKKVHLAIEQHLSPVSATLFLWKPSDHSALGHAALQIGQGRNQINTDQALAYNQSNYVSWWPMGSKSSSLNRLFDVSSEAMPDLKLRWKDFSQPAAQGESLAFDMQSEENDDFGLKSAEDKLKDFIKQVASASGVDEKFKDISVAFTMMALMNPDILESANIPEHISKPFVEQWNDTSYDMQDVAQRFAKELQEQAKVAVNSEQMEQQISEVVRRFAQDELDKIQTFKEMQADQGRVFRINLEGLDVAAMQAEWHRLSNDSDARYQLLNKNCSSIVAKVLKAGGADKLIGHTWRPKFGVWTPTELFNFAQDLQEAQLVSHTKKDKQHIDTDSLQSTDRVLESLGESKQTTLDLSSVLTKDELKNEAKVFAKPIGESYQKILDQLDLLHATQGDKQLEAALRLNNLVDDYVSSHEKSGRNTALLSLKNRVTESLYSNVAQESRVEIVKLSADRIDLAVDLLHRLRSSTNEVSSVVDIKSLADGTKYNSQESLAVLSKQEVPFNKDLQDQQLVQGRVTGEAVLNKVQLSDDEIKGIKWYTSEGFQYVNEALRKEEKLAYFVKDNAVNAVKGLSKLETFEGTVYRAFMPGVSLNDLASHVTPGQLFSDQGFTSTSTSTELAKSFRGGKGTVILTILDAKGTNVAGLAQLNQAEVLLKPGAHLRIEAVKETDQNLHIVAKYTEEFRAGEIVRNLFDGKTIGIAINQNTSTINESVVTSFDHDDITAMLKPKPLLEENKLGVGQQVQNRNVQNWFTADVTVIDGGDTRFDGQVIVQMENDLVVAKAAANLAGKHAESSVVVQLDSDGNYRVVYGDPSKLDGKLRWQLVGHGRNHSESNNTRLSGYSADELAVKLASFQQMFNQAEKISSKPDHISIVGCSLVSDDKQKGFGHQFINAMDANGLRVDVSVRSSELAVDEAGRKHTKDANGDWVQKAENNKVSLSWDAQGEVVAKDERIRNGIAEGDIDLSRIGVSDVDEPARGAIGDNNDVFDAPEKRKPETEVIANSSNSNQLSYSGNIQVNVGEGEFTAVNWGTSNVGIKVGTGGFKSLAFGDNNVMVHIGDGESKHSVDIGGYQALEGAQMFLGNRNVSFNFGHSNDLILMMDKSIPTPPLVNPFDGAARISGVLQGIAMSGEGEDWLAAQEQQWTLSGAKKFVKDMSGLDQSSSVDYTTLVELDSQNERDSRGLKHDAEATLNKQYNQWLSGNGNSGTSQLSRADKLRQANEKLAFNFAVGGQGADIQVTTGNWNFMFGDNIQSILDTNLGSLFGLMTQQFTATGQAKTTFTYTPQDLPRQLKNKLLGQLAGVGAETTLADIFGVDYTASGQIVSRNGQAVDGVAILKEMLEVIGEFSGDQLQAFVDPTKLLDSLKAGIDMGADGIKSFAETHGLKEKAPEEEKDNSSVSVNGANVNSAQGATVADGNTETAETQDRAFGFNSLNLPNLFATIFSQDKQKEMKSLVENLKQNLTADLLNMKEKTFDFLRNSGHLQGDGDINISLGNYNFNWGGDGKDLGAYLGDNNNFWGGRGDDVFYATGTSNIFTGGEGNDMGVLMGRENMMFGGDGNDTAVVAGRINHVFLGAGDDQSFVFGEGGEIDTGSGRDYVVTSGNLNRVDTGDDQDYSVTIGNNNQVELGAGNDFANVFGNYNRINAGAGNDVVKLMGYHAVLNGGDGDDHLIAAAISKFSQFNGGEGRDLMVLGGYQNTFKGGTDVDSFVVSGDVIDNLVEDIRSEDNIVFNGIDWQKLWFERSGYDLKLSILRDPSNDSDQSKFEHIGSVTFSDYFNGNRAQVVIGMSEKDLSGEREYTMLSDSAIDALVQAMSGFEPQAGDNGFIDSLESKSQAAISMAWSDVVHKKGLMV